MTTRYDQERFEDIIDEIDNLLEEAIGLIPEEVYDRAKSYWYSSMVSSLNNNSEFVKKSKCSMQDTLKEWISIYGQKHIDSDTSIDDIYIEPLNLESNNNE
tara:strand:- start:1227 stop:1529 length:303 start_codon:yes stop_codon:yes gene_type:complete